MDQLNDKKTPKGLDLGNIIQGGRRSASVWTKAFTYTESIYKLGPEVDKDRRKALSGNLLAPVDENSYYFWIDNIENFRPLFKGLPSSARYVPVRFLISLTGDNNNIS
jgi:hypothetical protein